MAIIERLRRHFTPGPGCWEWTGHRLASGYGLTRDANQMRTTAHRVVYEALVGPIPDGYQVDHLCRNRACVNPAPPHRRQPLRVARSTRVASVPDLPPGQLRGIQPAPEGADPQGGVTSLTTTTSPPAT